MNRLKEKFKRVDYGPQSADWGEQELQSLFTVHTFQFVGILNVYFIDTF